MGIPICLLKAKALISFNSSDTCKFKAVLLYATPYQNISSCNLESSKVLPIYASEESFRALTS